MWSGSSIRKPLATRFGMLTQPLLVELCTRMQTLIHKQLIWLT
ncbi:MAG: hypothetical protein WCK63_13135 [Betaproteobacteria bacterium]